ncbi:MAG: WecB/TagA/CpsF family glycosyltransferase, partial [Chloroflexota bacterium]
MDVISAGDVLRFVRSRVRSGEPAQICTVNAEYVMRARADVDFRRLLNRADVCTPDGAGVVWALRRQGIDLEYRVGGSDLIWSLCLQAEEFGH